MKHVVRRPVKIPFTPEEWAAFEKKHNMTVDPTFKVMINPQTRTEREACERHRQETEYHRVGKKRGPKSIVDQYDYPEPEEPKRSPSIFSSLERLAKKQSR
jgi:hypothetical protein